MAFPDDFANEFVPRSPVSPFGLELENIREDRNACIGGGDLSALLSSATGSLSIAEIQWTEVRFPSVGSSRCSLLAASQCLSALHYCTQPRRSNKLSPKSVVSSSQFTLSLARPHWRLGFKSSRSASPCRASSASSVFRSLRGRSSREFPLVYWQVALRALSTSTSKIRHSLWSPGPVALGALRGSSRARSRFVCRWPEHA